MLPRIRHSFVKRQHLLSLLTQYSHYPLTLITAPAGFGKTTLVKSWLSSEFPVAQTCAASAWLSLTQEDNEGAQLFKRIGSALASLLSKAEEDITLFQSDDPATMLPSLLQMSGEFNHAVMLVIDDFHHVTEPTLHRALTTFIEKMSPELHIVLISRSVPPLPFARWRANGRLAEIESDVLRFTQAEIRTFLSGIGVQPDKPALVRLEQRTEGWAAALQLLALATQNRSHDEQMTLVQRFSGENRYIFDYLIEEVVNQQRDEVRTFLIHTAILEHMNGSLVDALTLRSDGQQRLEQLARSNAFTTPLDETAQWYRYHPLFRETLTAHLQQTSPELTPVLHRRAAVWYSEQGEVARAVDHFVTASDFQGMADLLVRNADRMWTHQEMVNLRKWTQMLPEEMLSQHPRLMLFRAWALLMTGEPAMAESQLNSVTPRLKQLHPTDNDLNGIYAIIRAAVLLQRDPLQSLRWYDSAAQTLPETTYNWQGALALGRGFAYLETGDFLRAEHSFAAAVAPSRTCGNLYAAMYSIYNLGRAQMAQGALQRARSTFEYSLELARREPEPMQQLVSWAFLGLAEVEYERNNLTEATQFVLEAITIGKRRENRETVARAYLVLARIQFAFGQQHDALALLHLAENTASDASLTEIVTTIRLWQSRLYLAQGQFNEAQRLHALQQLGDTHFSTLHTTAIELLSARLLTAQGQTTKAQALLQKRTDQVRPVAIEIIILRALIAYIDNRLHEAIDYLQQALELSEPEFFCRVFLDEGEPMQALLTAAVKHLHENQAALKLLAEFNRMGNINAVDIGQALIEPLSRAELDILRLISQGLSNQRIADERFISLNTVKWHLKNLYGKLGVKSRTEAIAKARKLNLM